MADTDEPKLAVALPGEWAIKKTFGPVLGEIGDDMKKLYALGRDKIIIAGYKKIFNKDDGKCANLRVTRDVFWNGSFTDEQICAEYFGGIFAASRSEDGKDDTGVFYVDLIKSLSSNQLKLHYLIYLALNKALIADTSKSKINPGQEREITPQRIHFFYEEIETITGSKDIGLDLHALCSKDIIGNFQVESHVLKNGNSVHYIYAHPKPLGVQLYAVAHNKLDGWRDFVVQDFGSFDSIAQPKFSALTLENLLSNAGIKDETQVVENN